MPQDVPHEWEMSPRFRVLDSAVRGSHGDGIGAVRWQLHLIKQPSWDYSFLWMRPLDVADDAGFVAIDGNFDREWIFGFTERLQTQKKQIDAIFEGGALARRFVLNTRGQLRTGNQRAHDTLIVRRDGIATWRHSQSWEVTPFRWRQILTPISGADFVQLPAAQVWAELQTLLTNFDSEANFARQFARMSPLQRTARIQRPARGTLDELNRLLYDITLATPQWNDLGDNSEIYLSVEKSGEVAMWEIGSGQPIALDVPEFVREQVRQLRDYFQPFDRTLDFFLCARSSGDNQLFARAFRPSAHEQIEAQLRLRDWLDPICIDSK